MPWSAYPTQAEAQAAAEKIAVNMRLPVADGVTTGWSTPRRQADGTWVIVLPGETAMMDGVAPGTPLTAPIWPDDAEGGT